MRTRVLLTLFVLGWTLFACNALTGIGSLTFSDGADSGGAIGPGFDGGGPVGDATPPPAGDSSVPPSGTQIASSSTLVIEGVTDDGYVVYGDTATGTLSAISIAAAQSGTGSPIALGNADLSVVWVLHNVATFYASATSRVGPLSIWTSSMASPRQIASSSLETDFGKGEYTVAVSSDSAHILYYDNVDPTASSGTVYLGNVGNAAGGQTQLVGPIDVAEDNCQPELRFAGPYALASYCTVSGSGGKIPDAGSNYDIATISSWLTTNPIQRTVATNVQTGYRADDHGDAVVMFSALGLVAAPPSGGPSVTIDSTGTSFVLASDGKNVDYATTQSALKRAPTAAPTTSTQLAPAGSFAQLIDISKDDKWLVGALHSATGASTTDLYAASATTPGAVITLSTATTTASGLSGDSFTADSTYALFQTGYASNVGTLTAYPLTGGGSALTIAQGTYEEFGVTGTIVVFNANDANGKADLEWIDVAKGGTPTTLVSGADQSFFLTSAKDKIVYTYSAGTSASGLWVMNAPNASTPAGGCVDAGLPAFKAASGPKGSCTASQVQSLYDACFGTSSSTTACQALPTSLGSCYGCLVSTETSSTWGVLVEYPQTTTVAINLGGCFAVESASQKACASASEAQTACQLVECGTSSSSALAGCVTAAQSGPCACYVSGANSACAPFASSACVVPSTDTFEQQYIAVARVMCE